MKKKYGLQNLFDVYFKLMMVAIVFAVAIIGVFQPYMADDYTYFNIFRTKPGLAEFISSMYIQWTGRIQGLFFLWFQMYSSWMHLVIRAFHGPLLMGTAYLSLALALGRWPQVFKKDRLPFLFSVVSL